MPEVTEKIRAIFREEGALLIEPLSKAIQRTQDDVLLIKNDVSGLKNDVSGLKGDVSDLKSDMSGVKEDISDLKSDMSGVKEDISDLKSDMSDVKDDITGIREVVDSHTVTLDGMAGSLEIMRTELSVSKYRLDRHEGWITKLAQKTKLKLSH